MDDDIIASKTDQSWLLIIDESRKNGILLNHNCAPDAHALGIIIHGPISFPQERRRLRCLKMGGTLRKCQNSSEAFKAGIPDFGTGWFGLGAGSGK